MEGSKQKKDVVVPSYVVAAGAGHGGSSSLPDPTQPQNVVAATEVAAAGPSAGHGGLSAPLAPAAVEAPAGFPLLADLGDPYGDPPAFDEVVDNEYPEEDDLDVDNDKDSRDAKSRYVLRELQAGTIKYRHRGNLFCPFCVRIIANDHNSMIRHAVGVGHSSEDRAPHVKAKHAAYGVFLKKLLARDIRLGLTQPPRRSNSNQDKKARKARKAWKRQ